MTDQINKPISLPYEKQIIALPSDFDSESTSHVGMNFYQRVTQNTDQMPPGLEMPILGLFGEVGSLLSALKKKLRDMDAFTKYDSTILEELGDVLWYFTRIASRVNLDLSILAQRMFRGLDDWDEVESHDFVTFGDLEALCVFHSKAATHYTAKLPPISHESCHPLHGKAATPKEVDNRRV